MACENDKCEKYGMHHEYKNGIEMKKCKYCQADEDNRTIFPGWIDVKDKKPENDQVCYVFDADWSVTCYVAIYDKLSGKFIQYYKNLRDHPSLTVTHWIPFPAPFLR